MVSTSWRTLINRYQDAITLHLGFWLYLVLGGGIFYWIETPNRNYLLTNTSMETSANFCTDLALSVADLWKESNKTAPNHQPEIIELCQNLSARRFITNQPIWDFSAAIFMSMEIITTIGYGDLTPLTTAGKIFLIIYGFIGVPFGGILLAFTSDKFSNQLLQVYNSQKKNHNGKLAIWTATGIFLVPGCLLFLFMPAAIFCAIEDWSYVDGFYFTFNTLTTIGFGDTAVAQRVNYSWLWFYRVCIIIYMLVGMGFWAVIIGFVTKAFKSKKLARQWVKTAEAITSQAVEMRRAMEQLSLTSQNEFLPHKSKNAFQFALHLACSVSHLDCERQLTIPGIAAAMRSPLNNRQLGIHNLLELPIRLNRRQLSDNTDENAVQSTASEAVDDSPAKTTPRDGARKKTSITKILRSSSRLSLGIVGLNRQNTDNKRTSFNRSNAGDVEMQREINERDTEQEDSQQMHNIPVPLQRSCSRISLPIQSPSQAVNRKQLMRSQTCPELIESECLVNLLLEAMLILNEANVNGFDLSSVHS